ALAAASRSSGYVVVSGGALLSVGGTSAAAPVFAGMLVLVNHYLTSKETIATPGLGNVNPVLYRLAQSSANVFHDVTGGSNKVACVEASPGCVDGLVGFDAAKGYDLATGLGSVDAYQLASSWTLAGATSVSLNADPATSAPDSSVQVTARVTSTAGGTTVPTG